LGFLGELFARLRGEKQTGLPSPQDQRVKQEESLIKAKKRLMELITCKLPKLQRKLDSI